MKLLSALFEEINPFPNLFDSIHRIEHPKQLEKGNVLVIWGGEDIGTLMYNQRPNKYCYRAKPTGRDYTESLLILEAAKKNIPIIGVCRGAQLACVVAGGSLMQHIDHHCGDHAVTLLDEDGSVIHTNSTHHQMMMPNKEAEILAVASDTTGVDQHNERVHIPVVPEVVYFPKINALGIQGHPEYTSCPPEFMNYLERKIKEKLL